MILSYKETPFWLILGKLRVSLARTDLGCSTILPRLLAKPLLDMIYYTVAMKILSKVRMNPQRWYEWVNMIFKFRSIFPNAQSLEDPSLQEDCVWWRWQYLRHVRRDGRELKRRLLLALFWGDIDLSMIMFSSWST